MVTLWFIGTNTPDKLAIVYEAIKFLRAKGLTVVYLDAFNCLSVKWAMPVAEVLNKQGIVVVASFVSFCGFREYAKRIIPKVIEIWVKKKEEEVNMVKAENCDIRLDTGINSVESCVNMIKSYFYLHQLLDYPGHVYSMFIGRYQPFHEGHKKLIETALKEGKDVCVAIKDMGQNIDNPYSVEECREMIMKGLKKWVDKGRVAIIVIPNVMEVCYGRKVGWGVREIRLDKETEKISATKIRKGIK